MSGGGAFIPKVPSLSAVAVAPVGPVSPWIGSQLFIVMLEPGVQLSPETNRILVLASSVCCAETTISGSTAKVRGFRFGKYAGRDGVDN